ncbi:hypothetical protein ACCO45_001271 [Purpureocillium lilacinum]|uniref:Uncharacterized protein n=1 Tax=Purpureocillium lilacinum TaxID=33203 RepID=A0ACC4E6L5_PURLI
MASSRRLSDRAHRTRSSYHPRDLARRGWKLYLSWSEQVVAAYMRLSPLYRALAALACVLGWVVIILVLVYSHRFFAWLAPYSKSWRARPGGWLLIFFLIFVTAFPPTVLSGYVDRMVGRDHRFVALGQVLRHEGILYLTGIRFCPLPFSLSNGFLATIPSITPMSFAVSTALSSPKLLVHVFIGSRLAVLAEQGDSMTAGDKAINYLSMIIGGIIGILVGLAIYRRTMARAAELQREEGGAADELAAAEDGDAGYEDTEATLLDPEDAAAIMSDDDLSLWDTQGADSWGEDYHDDDITDDVQKTKKNGASD